MFAGRFRYCTLYDDHPKLIMRIMVGESGTTLLYFIGTNYPFIAPFSEYIVSIKRLVWYKIPHFEHLLFHQNRHLLLTFIFLVGYIIDLQKKPQSCVCG